MGYMYGGDNSPSGTVGSLKDNHEWPASPPDHLTLSFLRASGQCDGDFAAEGHVSLGPHRRLRSRLAVRLALNEVQKERCGALP